MATVTTKTKTPRTIRKVEGGVDPSWKTFYRIGGISAALYILLILVPIVLVILVPQPPQTGGAAVLEYIASNKLVYMVELIAFVGLSLPAIVVFMALYLALKGVDKSYAALGALTGITSEILALAINSSPPSLNGSLVYLSDQYTAANSPAQQTALAAAAESFISLSNAVNVIGILTAAAILIFSLVMLKGVFSKAVAYLGIATGAIGMISEALRDIIGPGYFVYGLLLPAWFFAAGWKLYRLSRD